MTPSEKLWREVLATLAPPTKQTVSEFADTEIVLPPETSANPGQWITARAPYQREMMDVFNDPAIDTIVFMMASRMGKTAVMNNIIGFCVAKEPAPILIVKPTLEMGDAWSKDELAPIVRDTPCLRGLISDVKSRDEKNTILHKIFPGGRITICGANSGASLSARTVRFVLCDEIDRYEASAGTEGDPIKLAFKRCTTYWNKKKMVVSTPKIDMVSRIQQFWESSDKRLYYVPCPHCGEYQVLVWKNMKWPKGPNGEHITDQAAYICEYCQKPMTDADKPTMLAKGEWRATAKSKGVAGFHINEIYSPWVTFKEMVDDFLEAKKSPDTLQVFVNTSLGEPWSTLDNQISDSVLMERREDYPAPVPMEACVLVCGVDIQDNRIETEVIGVGPGEETWNIANDVIPGDTAHWDVYNDLDKYLVEKEWQHESGLKLKIACTCIDAGHRTDMVYAFVNDRQHRRIYAVKGSSKAGLPIVGRPSSVDKWKNLLLFPVGTDTAKELIYGRLRIETVGPSYCHFPMERDAEYFRQLTAEKLDRKWKSGRLIRKWVKTRERNEVLDMRVYAIAALRLLNPDYEALAAGIKGDAEKLATEKGKIEPPRDAADDGGEEYQRRPRRNWVTDY